MFLYEFDAKPMLDLEDVKTLIPSHDDVWEDPCLVAQGKMNFTDMTLSDALETIYMEKKLPSHLGEFSSKRDLCSFLLLQTITDNLDRGRSIISQCCISQHKEDF